MHILFIADGDNKYGASQSMKQLIEGLIKYCENIEISVVLPLRVDLAEHYHQLGCHTYRILYEPFYQSVPDQKWKMPIKYVIRGVEYLLGRGFAVYCLGKKIDMSKVDIIHANSSRVDFAAELAMKYNKPLIWHIREFGDMDYKCFSFRKNYISLMNESAVKFIAVSDAVKEHWIKKGLNKEKIIRIYNGVKESTYNKIRGSEYGKVRLLMLGSICETKGQYQIIQAFERMTWQEREKFELNFIGDGAKSYIRKMIKKVEEAGLSQIIHFLGYQEDLQRKISEYDCGIMCSKSEGFGRVTIEYMMAGLPVIASNTGANKELIIDNSNGLLYQWNNIDDLKRKLIFTLNNIKLLHIMGENAREYALTCFSIKKNVGLVYSEYIKILKSNNFKKNRF